MLARVVAPRGEFSTRRRGLPLLHRTLHRYSWERAMRHEAAGQALHSLRLRHGLGMLLGAMFLLLFLTALCGLLDFFYQAGKLMLAR